MVGAVLLPLHPQIFFGVLSVLRGVNGGAEQIKHRDMNPAPGPPAVCGSYLVCGCVCVRARGREREKCNFKCVTTVPAGAQPKVHKSRAHETTVTDCLTGLLGPLRCLPFSGHHHTPCLCTCLYKCVCTRSHTGLVLLTSPANRIKNLSGRKSSKNDHMF